MPERWRTIPGWEMYQASAMGNIKRLAGLDIRGRYFKERVLKPQTDSGSRAVCLCNGPNRMESRPRAYWILLTFVGNPSEDKPFACHIDDNPKNNKVSNLYWGNFKTNHEDAMRNGKKKRHFWNWKGRSFTPEHREKLYKAVAEANRNRVESEETRQKRSKSLREWHARRKATKLD